MQDHETHVHEGAVEESTASPAETSLQPSPFKKGLLAGVGAIVGVLVIGSLIAGYRSPDSVPWVTSVLAAVRAPAAVVNGTWVTWHDIKVDAVALQKYLDSQAMPSSLSADDIRARVLHRIMFAQVADDLAQEMGIAVTDAKLDEVTTELETSLGGKEKVEQEIQNQYGWTYAQYRERVIRSMLTLEALQNKINTDESLAADAKKRIEEVQAQLKAGKDFAELAKQVSEDSSAPQGGELGPIRPGDTVKEFEDAAFKLAKGGVSGVVKSEFGYHIIKANEVKKDKKGVVEEMNLSHILIKTPSVRDVVQKRLDEASVWQFVYTEQPAKSGLDTLAAEG